MSDTTRTNPKDPVDPIPEGYGTVTPYLIVEDGDAFIRFAQEAFDATLVERADTPEDTFYGDRTGGIQDPFGTQWWIATRMEVLSPEEMERRQREG
jgi:PhnB protein